MCYGKLAKELLKSLLLRSQSEVKILSQEFLVSVFDNLQMDCPLLIFIQNAQNVLCVDRLE